MDGTAMSRSIARLGVAIATADRRVTSEEIAAFGHLDALGLGSLADAVREALEQAAEEPVDVAATCAALRPLSEQAAALLLTVLAEIATSDRELAPSERAVFDDIARGLGLRATIAARILDAAQRDGDGRDDGEPAPAEPSQRPWNDHVQRAFQLLRLDPRATREVLDATYMAFVQRYDPHKMSELGADFAALAVRRLATITDAYDVARATVSG